MSDEQYEPLEYALALLLPALGGACAVACVFAIIDASWWAVLFAGAAFFCFEARTLLRWDRSRKL